MKYIVSQKTMDALHSLKALLAEPHSWTKMALARNAARISVPPTSNDAICWCLTGAMMKVSSGGETQLSLSRLISSGISNIVAPYAYRGIEPWNDTFARGHSDVVKLIDDTIANCEVSS